MHQQDSNPVDHAKILLENASQEIQAFDEKNRRTAATFNFFTAISRFDDENRHSRFIASLLDPQGEHGQGSLFLEFFVEALPIQGIDTDRLSEWAVRTEVAFSKDRGRIDILLSGPDGIIGIENKVFAQESDGQLASYTAALADYPQKDAHLVFLTPEGREPAEKISTEDVNLVECAYDPDASPSLGAWLERCRDAVSEIPRLEIILTQYIEIIRRVSGRTLTMDQQQKVAGLLKDRESLEAAKALEEGLKEKKIDLQYQFWKKLAERVTSGLQSPRNERSGIV
ncbi:MAG: PD-(D/E)XK nuclease family protein, partial [Thiohalospira sp.]